MDLFENNVEKLLLEGADVVVHRNFCLGKPYASLLNEFIENTPWRSERIKVWGREVAQPRLIAWYGDPDTDYTYSGLTLSSNVWTNTLLTIKRKIEDVSDTTFNSVLINYYRDHNDSMGFHCDDEKELGDRPVIASLSLGEERRFQFKHRFSKTLKQVEISLREGDLLIMRGNTQKHWKHGIPKERIPCGPRINLTFRKTNQDFR